MTSTERQLEEELIAKLQDLKYVYRADIRDRLAPEENFRAKFQELNRVTLTDEEFARLLEEIVTPDVFTASQTLRSRNSFTRVFIESKYHGVLQNHKKALMQQLFPSPAEAGA